LIKLTNYAMCSTLVNHVHTTLQVEIATKI